MPTSSSLLLPGTNWVYRRLRRSTVGSGGGGIGGGGGAWRAVVVEEARAVALALVAVRATLRAAAAGGWLRWRR